MRRQFNPQDVSDLCMLVLSRSKILYYSRLRAQTQLQGDTVVQMHEQIYGEKMQLSEAESLPSFINSQKQLLTEFLVG